MVGERKKKEKKGEGRKEGGREEGREMEGKGKLVEELCHNTNSFKI